MKIVVVLALVGLAFASAEARRKPSDDVTEMIVKDVYPVHHAHASVVLLKTRDGKRYLPIWIGESEALAISLRLAHQRAPRPLTHDLLDRVLGALGAKVTKIHIDDVRAHVFVGRIFVRHRKGTAEIDARPSDSIALAIGAGAPIFAAQRVLRRAGLSEKDIRAKARPEPQPQPAHRDRARDEDSL